MACAFFATKILLSTAWQREALRVQEERLHPDDIRKAVT